MDDANTFGSEQDSEPDMTEDVTEPLPIASSTRFAVPKGPSGRPDLYFELPILVSSFQLANLRIP